MDLNGPNPDPNEPDMNQTSEVLLVPIVMGLFGLLAIVLVVMLTGPTCSK